MDTRTKKEIKFAMETFYDLGYNDMANGLFEYLEKLIQRGHEISIYWIESGNINRVCLTRIADVDHLNNFKKSLKVPFKSI